jgi:mRNA deadenylase 3'-5' endonuclease subunit Ccr4
VKNINIQKKFNSINLKQPFINKITESNYIEYIKTPKIKTFTILSYNILSQRFMKRKEIKSLSLEIRIPKIINEINKENPDIFCLQESTFDVYQKYFSKSFNDYEIIKYDNEGSYLMNLIGIRKNRFTLLNECKFDLSNKIIDINGNRGVINVKIKDNLYKDKIISLFCVHFPWKPIYEYQKARILLMIFEFILQNKNENIIISGDFNSIPNSIPLRMIYYQDFINEFNENKDYIGDFVFNKNEINLMKEVKQKMKKRENFKNTINKIFEISKLVYEKYLLRSVYDEYKINENNKNNLKFNYLRNHPDYTNYTKTFINTIDYIIYSKFLEKVKIKKIPIINNDYLPNETFPSDHLKLFAEFKYSKKINKNIYKTKK